MKCKRGEVDVGGKCKTLYHGTSCRKAESILKEGLKVGCYPVHEESLDEDRAPDACAIFLTDDFDTAVEYGYDASKECEPGQLNSCSPDFENICVFRVISLKSKILPDNYEDLMVLENIPTKDLELIPSKEIAKRLGFKSLAEYYGVRK